MQKKHYLFCLLLFSASLLLQAKSDDSGTAPTVITNPTIITGCNAMVGRLTATGNNIIEQGFCWAEHPDPTLADEHTTYNHNNAETGYSPVYIMYGLKASTEYWVRAYAINETKEVGYGDIVRVITLPQGETEYSIWESEEYYDKKLDVAMRDAVAYYNTWTAIKNFYPIAYYNQFTETADCCYGGWINVGPWRCDTPTMVHELMHGTGVGQHWRWWDTNLHDSFDIGGVWHGERANRVTDFFVPGFVCNGDRVHVCWEGNGNDTQQIRSCLLMQALYEDGLPAVDDGACPFYSFESIDTVKYYITNVEFGTNTKYLRETTSGNLQYIAPENLSRMLDDDAYAWNFIYDKMTGLYYVRNVRSGKYFSHAGSDVTLKKNKPKTTETIQLMPARIYKEYNISGTIVNKKPYWFARGNRVCEPNVMAITGERASSVVTPTLDFSNNATTQFWMIYSLDELQKIDAENQALNADRLERLIEGCKTVITSNHKEMNQGQDAAFLATVNEIEQEKIQYTASQKTDAVDRLFNSLTDYLPSIIVLDSIDISFIMDDAALQSGRNWQNLPALTDGMLRMSNTPVFTATQESPVKMPRGQYGLKARGYQRPGSVRTAIRDYQNDDNKVQTYITFNTVDQRLMHIAEGGSEEKLENGGSEIRYKGIYVPNNNAAITAYINAGRYDNLLKSAKTKLTISKLITIGLKNIQSIDDEILVVDGFQLFYYGNPNAQTSIEETDASNENNEIEGYYDLNGIRITQPLKGISIIKYKDGRSVKTYK